MPTLIKNSKSELQTILKDKYKINKNISEELTADECRQLLSMLSQGNVSLEKILAAYADKNSALGKNNALYGRQRSSAEKKAIQLQQEYKELQQNISQLGNRKTAVSSEQQRLVEQVKTLEEQKLQLSSKIKQLDSSNNELVKVNHELKKDNKHLKNLVDSIRLKLSKDLKDILIIDNSEIKKALTKLFQSTLG
jgi:regulator of replication initiation timing